MSCRSLSCITPPHLLRKLMESDQAEVRNAALGTLLSTTRMRGEREVRSVAGFTAIPAAGRRTVYDCLNNRSLQLARVSRTEDGQPVVDDSVNRAFEGLGTTREFYKQ